MEDTIGHVIYYSRRRRFGVVENKDDIYYFQATDIEYGYRPNKNDIVVFEPHDKHARKIRNAESLLRPSEDG